MGQVVLLMWGELSYESGPSFMWGDLSWDKLSVIRTV